MAKTAYVQFKKEESTELVSVVIDVDTWKIVAAQTIDDNDHIGKWEGLTVNADSFAAIDREGKLLISTGSNTASTHNVLKVVRYYKKEKEKVADVKIDMEYDGKKKPIIMEILKVDGVIEFNLRNSMEFDVNAGMTAIDVKFNDSRTGFKLDFTNFKLK